ncbi:protein serine/threonine phosphatase 2C [Trametes meyenii]|nr:protein serine/threonine phosphatase 2C [Trametes meyenii]
MASFACPLTTRINQDRLAVQAWEIFGQKWIFLAVCDGHGDNPITAQHTVTALPQRLKGVLSKVLEDDMHGMVDHETLVTNADIISSALGREIQRFDEGLSTAIKELCPEPTALTEDQSETLVDDNLEVLQQGYYGSTFVSALVSVANRCMWVFNVGDSTVGISCESPTGRRDWTQLCDLHRLTEPLEYFRVAMAHPREELEKVTQNNRVLGWLSMTRSIGDSAMKLDRAYITHVFDYVPDEYVHNPAAEFVKTPPYLSAEPSVRFFDLEPVWDAKPTIIIFSDGVDTVANYYYSTLLGTNRETNPGPLVARILGNDLDRAEAGDILGHPIDPAWDDGGNKAVMVLGNLFGGTNAERIQDANIQANWTDRDSKPSFYIDDTTIIVCTVSG